jgi:hypothetical protein
VRGVHRESGLADPGHPADRVNAQYRAARGHRGQGFSSRHFLLAAWWS